MGIGGEAWDELLAEGDADALGFGFGSGKGAVIEALAATETGALAIKSESWAEKDINLVGGGDRAIGGRFGDVECSGWKGVEGGDFVEHQIGADDSWERPAVLGEGVDQFEKLGFIGKG